MVDKRWTFDEAHAAQERFRAGGGKWNDPAGPLFQWVALHNLDSLRQSYEAGDAPALFAAIRVCANHDVVMPDWVARAFIRCYDQVLNCRVKTWGEAFGPAFPKNTNLAAERKRRELMFAVWNEMTTRHRAGELPIDQNSFEIVGERFGISGSTARDYYYAAQNRLTKTPGETL